jgi:DNA polymerase-1
MLITKPSELIKLKGKCTASPIVALDIETAYTDIDSIFTHTATLISIFVDTEAYCIDVRKIPEASVVNFLKSLRTKIVIGHNLKFDCKVLKHMYGVDFERPYDTMLAAQVVECGAPKRKGLYTLESVTRRYVDPFAYSDQGNLFLPYVSKKLRTTFGNIGEFTAEQITYAKLDVEYVTKLFYVLNAKAKELDLERSVDLENRYLRVVIAMEYHGIGFNVDTWEANIPKIKEAVEYYESLLSKIAPINWNSDKQVKGIFKNLGIDIVSVDKDTLQMKESVSKLSMAKHKGNDLVGDYLRYKELRKALDTYGLKFIENVDKTTLRIHTSFFQVMSTGRTSSSSPNCQNIPRDEAYRAAFESKDHFIVADYSAQEIRIAADKAEVVKMIEGIKNGEDLHLKTARLVYKDDTIEKSDPRRQLAKNIQFTILYGGGASKIAKGFGIPIKEARKLIDAYFETYPSLREYLDRVQREALEKGYILINEVSGRKSFISEYDTYLKCKEHVEYFRNRGWEPYPKIESKARLLEGEIRRAASNFPIQGTAADMAKEAGIKMLERSLNPLLMVHDEWVVETKNPEGDVKIVEECMEDASKLFLKHLTATATAVVTKIWNK